MTTIYSQRQGFVDLEFEPYEVAQARRELIEAFEASVEEEAGDKSQAFRNMRLDVIGQDRSE